jgi:hypothetical protein
VEDAANIIPANRPDAVTSIHHALVSFQDGVDFQSAVEGYAYNRPHGRVHAWCVPAAGKNGNSFHDFLSLILPLFLEKNDDFILDEMPYFASWSAY